MEGLYAQIARLAEKYGAVRLKLFGSRARGDHRSDSDIDLAVYGMPERGQGAFRFALEELPTLLEFDVTHITSETNHVLLEEIEKDGVTLMDKFEDKYDKLSRAMLRLRESLDMYKKEPNEFYQDSVIKRFEFTAELAWKTIREYLLAEGITSIDSPKSVLRRAYSAGIVENEEGWLNLLNDRNATAHIYDQATSDQILERIRDQHFARFEEIVDKLK